MSVTMVHPLLGWISGMCSDELPHAEIDAKVLEAKEAAHLLEAEVERLRREAEDLAVTVRVLTTAYLAPAAQDPENYEAQEIMAEVDAQLAKWPRTAFRSDLGLFNPRAIASHWQDGRPE